MADPDQNGTVKIEGAKSAIISLTNALPQRTNIGLLTYPGDSNCGAPITAQTLAPLDSTDFGRSVASLPDPNGGTPTALALTTAVERLKGWGITQATVVLVSDGESNCGNDPCDEAKAVVAGGYQLTVNTVGFDITTGGEAELQCIADATNGIYASVDNSAQLGDALNKLSRPVLSAGLSQPPSPIPVTTQSVRITATVTNTSNLTAHNVRVSLISNLAKSSQSFAVRTPVKYLGNIDPGVAATEVSWDVIPDVTSASTTSRLDFTLRSDDANPLSQPVILTFGSLDPTAVPANSAFHGRHKVLVLGDSFSSGEGADSPQQPFFAAPGQAQDCHRTKNQYAGWIFGAADVTVVACSGAITDNLFTTGQRSEPTQATQLDRLLDDGYRPDFVFMSIGGNDIGFSSIVTNCVVANLSKNALVRLFAEGAAPGAGDIVLDQTQQTCPADPDNQELYTRLGETIRTVSARLPQLYGKVAQEFANRKLTVPPIVIVPYPVLVPLDPTTRGACTGVFTIQRYVLSLHQLDGFLRFQLAVNAAMEKAVTTAHSKGIPVYYATDVQWAMQPDHSICSASQWLNAIQRDKSKQELIHPNVAGHRSMAIELLRWSQTPGLALRGATLPPDPPRPGLADVLGGLAHSAGQLLGLGPNQQSGRSVTIHSGDVTVTVDGLQPGSSVTIIIRSSAVPLAVGVADARGHFEGRTRIDGSVVPLGRHQLEALVQPAGGTSAIWGRPVEVDEPTPTVVVVLLLVGGALVLLGLVVLLFRRILLARDRHGSSGFRRPTPRAA